MIPAGHCHGNFDGTRHAGIGQGQAADFLLPPPIPILLLALVAHPHPDATCRRHAVCAAEWNWQNRA